MDAQRSLQELHQLLSNSSTLLPEDVLKSTRTVLIQKPSTENLSLSPDSSETFFSLLLLTAQNPAISHPHRALAADTVSAWLIRARTHPSLRAPFPKALDPLCDIFLAHFDDATPGLTKALKDLLANTLSLAALVEASQRVVRALATKGLVGVSVGEGRKAGYYALEASVRRGVGAGWVFEAYPGGAERLVRDMLSNLVDRNLGPAIGRAVIALLVSKRKELIEEGKGDKEWLDVWEGPLSSALKNEELRQRVAIYVLPGVLKPSAECFRAFVQGLGLSDDGDVKNGDADLDLGALLCCLRTGKELGFVGEIGGENEPKKAPKAPVVRLSADLVAPLLGHAFPHIRVSAFNLVVQSSSVTLPFTPGALDLLKTALPPLHAESDAEVRDLVIGGIRNLIERVACSSYSSERELKNLHSKLRTGARPTPDDIRRMIQLDSRVRDAKDFCGWYIGFLGTLLRPGSNYQRCITGLRSFGFLIRSGVDASLVDYAFSVAPGNGSVASNGEPFKKGLFKWPEFSKQTDIFRHNIKKALLEAMFNPFDDVRAMASEILLFEPKWSKSEVKFYLERGLQMMNESGRARDADGVARTVALVFEIVKRGDITFEANDQIWGFAVNDQGLGLGVVNWVLRVIKEYLGVAATDFQRAVRERPIHGLFASLGMILESVYSFPLSGEDVQAWKEVHERLFRDCEEIWRLTKAPLCFDSPEGHVPSDIDEEDEDMNTQTVMSYSWRAVKESSSLLGTVLGKAPSPTLNPADFERGGKLLLQQLADIRHRGAFSAVSPSFVALCTRCFKSSDATLQELPRAWLRINLNSILEKSNAITRRSAGLPYLIVGVLASEVDPVRPLLTSTFTRFVEIATLPASASKNGEKTDLPQVHALNCLKFLFTDARVSQVVVPFIGNGLELAVSCFGSEIWAIRNCGVMLFTALTNRLFGTRRSRNDYVSNITTRSFFEKYASVRIVLLKNLQEKVSGLEGGDVVSVEMVYPALSLIARMEVDPEYEGMEEFREPIDVCMQSRIWKVREMAARAYTALVGPKNVVMVIRGLMSVSPARQNILHGNLCAVRALLERRVKQAVVEEQESGEVWGQISEIFAEKFHDLVNRNMCAVTKAAMLQLLTAHSKKFVSGEERLGGLSSWLEEYLVLCTHNRNQEIGQSSVVGRSMLKEQLVAFDLTYTESDQGQYPAEILALLSEDDEEINLYTVNHILALEHLPSLSNDVMALLVGRLWEIATSHPWNLLRAASLTLLHRIYTTASLPPPPDSEHKFETIMSLMQNSPTEPIKEISIALLGPLALQLPKTTRGPALQSLLQRLNKANHEDEPYTTRTAVLTSLSSLASILSLASTEIPQELMPAYTLLFDLLNDDDDDIRQAATKLAQKILPDRAQILLLPHAAAEKLALSLPHCFPGSSALLKAAVHKITGAATSPVTGADARAAWEDATKKDTILFQREKQNLWLDVVGVVEVWGVVAELVLARGVARKEEMEGLRAWFVEARLLLEGAGTDIEEVLGRGGEEDVVAFVARVRVVSRILDGA